MGTREIVREERSFRVFVHGVWIGLCMSYLIREERQGVAEYRSCEDAAIHAIETGASVWDPAFDRLRTTAKMVVLSDDAGHPGPSPDDDAEAWLRSWSQSGWEGFNEAFRVASDVARSDSTQLVVRPSSSGMLSDAVCTLNWCTRGAGQHAQLLLDPLGWVVASMMRDLEDHLVRFVELSIELIAQGRVWGLLVRSVDWNESRSELIPVSLGHGSADPEMLIARLSPLIQACERVVVMDRADIARIQTSASSES